RGSSILRASSAASRWWSAGRSDSIQSRFCLVALGPRFRGDERLICWRTLSPFVPAEARTQSMQQGSTIMSNEAQQIIGTWKLVSVMYEDQETKALTPIMGDNPRGFQIATKDGRWLALATPTGRKVPETDDERAHAFRTMI